jgi:hypothetical protein
MVGPMRRFTQCDDLHAAIGAPVNLPEDAIDLHIVPIPEFCATPWIRIKRIWLRTCREGFFMCHQGVLILGPNCGNLCKSLGAFESVRIFVVTSLSICTSAAFDNGGIPYLPHLNYTYHTPRRGPPTPRTTSMHGERVSLTALHPWEFGGDEDHSRISCNTCLICGSRIGNCSVAVFHTTLRFTPKYDE